jgi:hypothetical protein
VRPAGGQAVQPLGVHASPGRPPFRCAAGAWLSWLGRLEPQHHAAWGALALGPASHLPWASPGAPESLSPLPPPSRTPTPLSLPPHLTQAKTSKSNVLLSNSAQSTRGVLSCLPSCLAAVWGASLASSTPAWGSASAGVSGLSNPHSSSTNGNLRSQGGRGATSTEAGRWQVVDRSLK